MRELGAFLLVGTVAYIVYVLAFLATRQVARDMVAISFAYSVSLTVHFLLTKQMVFAKHASAPLTLPLIVKYVLVGGCCYGLSTSVALAMFSLNVPVLVALALAVAVTTCFSFVVIRSWVFT